MKKFLAAFFCVLLFASVVCSVVFGCLWGKANKDLKADGQIEIINNLKSENKALEDELEEANRQNIVYKAENDALRSENETLSTQNEQLTTDNATLTEQANKASQLQTQNAELLNQLAYYQELLSAYENDTRLPVTFYLKDEVYDVKLVEENDNVQIANPQLLPGEHFVGWSKDKTNIVDLATTPITQSTQLYAILSYDVNFTLDGTTFATLQIREGSTITEPPTCTTQNNENFYGYSLNGTDIDDLSAIEINGVTTIKAVVGFKVTFIDGRVSVDEIVRYNNTVSENYAGGSMFRGWTLDSNPTQDSVLVDPETYVITQDTTFYASYYSSIIV